MLGVKLAGSVLVLVACTGLGLDKSLEYRRRLRMLSELRRMFLLLAGEIRSSRTPAGDAFSHMAARMDGIYRDFLEKLSGALRQEGRGRFDRLWKEQVLESFEKSPLNREELELLLSFGNTFGYLDAQMQLAAIDFFQRELAECYEKLLVSCQGKMRVARLLGVTAGVFLVILLV